MATVLMSQYSEIIDQFTVIDCRYPYEFEGGHIQVGISVLSS